MSARTEGNPPVTTARSVSGPEITPTIVAQDGIREVPHLFEYCEVNDLIALIASMLDRLITHNDRIPLTPTSLTRFHSRAPPTINVLSYLLRIARYTNVEPCCLLILLPYVDKVCARLPTFTVSSLTVHRFIIAGISVGSKALSDAFCTNGRYARVGGVSIAEMNLLEKEFCEAIDWRLTTTGAVLSHYYLSLVHSHPGYRLNSSPPPTRPSSPVLSASIAMSLDLAPPYPPRDVDPDSQMAIPSSFSSPSTSTSASTNTTTKTQPLPISVSSSSPRGRTRKSGSRASPQLIPAPTKNTISASAVSSPIRGSARRLASEEGREVAFGGGETKTIFVRSANSSGASSPSSSSSLSTDSKPGSLLSSTRPPSLRNPTSPVFANATHQEGLSNGPQDRVILKSSPLGVASNNHTKYKTDGEMSNEVEMLDGNVREREKILPGR